MSSSLVRRGLELLSDDIRDIDKGKKSQVKKTPSKVKAMELVSTKRQGVTKQLRRLQGVLGSNKSKATVKDKRIKSAIEEYRKKQGKSQMSVNLQYFLETDLKASNSDTMKILHQNTGRQSRNRPECPTKKAAEPESLFTEAEFEQFQKEYFGRTVENKE